MEIDNRRNAFRYALEAILKPIGVMAARKPDSIGATVLKTFEAIGGGHDYLKAGLVQSLGHMAASAQGAKLALPALYQSMTSQSARVRAAGAKAYARLAERDSNDLPSLVHETFLLLLRDPYVIVHAAAVDALEKVRLPAQFTDRVIACLGNIIAAYSRSRSDDNILSASLERMFELLRSDEKPRLDAWTREVGLFVVTNMKTSAAAQFVAHNGFYLRGTVGLGKLLVKLLSDPDISEYMVDDLVAELAHVDSAEIMANADDLCAIATAREARGQDLTDEFVEILTAAGAWSAAKNIATQATSRFNDTVWDRPKKLRAEARETAAALEFAAAESNVEQVIALTEKWRSIEKETKGDNEKNREKRSPLIGLPLPHQGE